MKSLALILSLAGVFLIEHAANAGREDRRQGAQRARIREGAESGELTRGEAARARRDQRHIQRMENRADADGQVTEQELNKIEKAQDRASARIYRMKHNGRERQR